MLYVLEQQLVVFYMYINNAFRGDKDHQVIYVMNFLWHATPYVQKLFNWLLDQNDKKLQTESATRVFNRWLQLASDYCGTVAGDEVLGAYVELYKRFNDK